MTGDDVVGEQGALLLDTENLFYRTEVGDCTEWLAAILWWSGEQMAWVRDRRSYGQPWDKAVMKLEPLLRHYGFELVRVPAEPDAADDALIADLREMSPGQPVVVGSGDAKKVLSSAHDLIAEGRTMFAITGHHGDDARFRGRFLKSGDLSGFKLAMSLRKVYRQFLHAQQRSDPAKHPTDAPDSPIELGGDVPPPRGLDVAQLPWDELSPASTGVSFESDAWQEKAAAVLVEQGADPAWATEFVGQLKPALERTRNRYHHNEFTLRRSHWRRWVLAAVLLAGMWPTAAASSPATQVLARADAIVMGGGDPELSRAMELAHERLRTSFPLTGELAWRLGRR